MTTISVKIDFGHLTPELITKEFQQFRQDTTRRSQDILLKEIRDEVISRHYVVAGDLLESWNEGDLEETTDITRLTVQSDDIAAATIENGAVPAEGGIVNVAEIFEWAQRKGIRPEKGTLENFAWAVARAIGQSGQPLHGGLKRPWHNAQKKAKRKIDKLWDRELDKFIDRLNAL